MFQFTHPGKGATGTDKRIPVELVVSIHAPWEGCDLLLLCQLFVRACFNSRTLGRVRLIPTTSVICPRVVSIHAPWEGCDCCTRASSLQGSCFNSRTLGRVRPEEA